MKKRFKELLHQYKVESFKISHGNDQVAETTKEILASTEAMLNNAYHFHFHNDPNPQRIETFNMIKHFTLESLMPPVMEKVMRRIVVLERQHGEMVKLLGELLETLSQDNLNLDAQAS